MSLTQRRRRKAGNPAVNLANPSAQEVLFSGRSFAEFTVYTKFDFTSAPVSNQRIWHLFTTNSNEAFLQYNSNGILQFQVDGGTPQDETIANVAQFLSGSSVITVAARANDAVIYIDGVERLRSSSINMPATDPAEINVAQANGGTNVFGDSITEFQYYARRLPDTIAQNLGG